jgi:hypothetical protein
MLHELQGLFFSLGDPERDLQPVLNAPDFCYDVRDCWLALGMQVFDDLAILVRGRGEGLVASEKDLPVASR